jgi:hypothetical protein
MQLPMASGVKKLAIHDAIRAAQHLRDYVMAVPPSVPGDGFAATDAPSALCSPKRKQLSTTHKCLGHVSALTRFEVYLP